MKKVWNILFFAFFIFCMFLLKPRQDIVFAALNESQCISLFEEDRDFVLLVEENNSYTGTYTLVNDTILLKYKEQTDPPNQRNSRSRAGTRNLPARLYIHTSTSQIRSADNKSFNAKIFLDERGKSFRPEPNKSRITDVQYKEISAIGARP